MILATLAGGGPDGTLVVVSRDRRRFALPAPGPRTMQAALDRWGDCEDALEETFLALDEQTEGMPVERARFAAPLPRAYHWAEGSCYLQHMERIRRSRGEALPTDHVSRPIVYQTGGHANLPPDSTFRLPDPTWDLDLEATVVVVTGEIPMGAGEDQAAGQIRLVGLTNDLTYRRLLVEERRQGTGTYLSKPGRAYAPFVVTPASLDGAWHDHMLRARTRCEVNGSVLGEPWADRDLTFGFPTILALLATTRDLGAGSIVGTGTVSNAAPDAGHACIAERRAVEIVEQGQPLTPYLQPGDRMTVEALLDDGTSVFGRIHQTVAGT